MENDTSAPRFSLKDQLFHRAKVALLAEQLGRVETGFEQQAFLERVVARFPQLELKARIDWISQCLREFLPEDYRQATELILKALPAPCDPDLSDDDFGDFIYAPYSHFVASYGCRSEDLDFSLEALRQITQRFSAEYAIRPFLQSHREPTLAILLEWTKDPHYHVRRLCSEGTRPRLPWAPAVRLDWQECLAILQALHADTTRFVTRSVANHLNDWSKSHHDQVLETLASWREQAAQHPQELDFIEKHALRSLVKQGHAVALRQLGYSPDVRLEGSHLQLVSPSVKLGQSLEFSFQLQALEQAAQVVVDYQIHFQSSRGKLENRKTFKLKNLQLQAGQAVVLSKRHPLRNMTTRRLFPGPHRLVVLINGQSLLQTDFELKVGPEVPL